MENLIQTMISQAPNLIVAIWMLNNQKEQIKALLDTQQKLIDRLLTYVDNDKAEARQMIVSGVNHATKVN